MLFDKPRRCHPDAMAITDLQTTLSWQQLHNQAMQLSRYLKDVQGLAVDDHVALLIGNRVEFITALLGGILAGLWITPINTHLLADEIDYIAQNSAARVLLYDHAHAALVRGDRHYIPINIEPLCDDLSPQAGVVSDAAGLNAPAGGTMLYTSGTTGRPKGVKRSKPVTLGEAFQRMQAAGCAFGLNGEGPHLVTGPLYHAAPMLFALYDLLNGAPMVIMPKWDNQQFLDLVKSFHVAHTHLVPTMFVRLLNERQRRESHDVYLSDLGFPLCLR